MAGSEIYWQKTLHLDGVGRFQYWPTPGQKNTLMQSYHTNRVSSKKIGNHYGYFVFWRRDSTELLFYYYLSSSYISSALHLFLYNIS